MSKLYHAVLEDRLRGGKFRLLAPIFGVDNISRSLIPLWKAYSVRFSQLGSTFDLQSNRKVHTPDLELERHILRDDRC